MANLTATSWGSVAPVKFAGPGAGIGKTVGGPFYIKPTQYANASKSAITSAKAS